MCRVRLFEHCDSVFRLLLTRMDLSPDDPPPFRIVRQIRVWNTYHAPDGDPAKVTPYKPLSGGLQSTRNGKASSSSCSSSNSVYSSGEEIAGAGGVGGGGGGGGEGETCL